MPVARLVYSSVLALRESEFTEAARALGGSGPRILSSHLIPNAMAPVIVISTLGFGYRVVSGVDARAGWDSA